jgi:hypothetical protein
MALTFNGVAVGIADSALPPEYVKPTVTAVTNCNWCTIIDELYVITKASVNDADPAIMFGNIVSSVSTQIQATINSSFNTGVSDFTAYATMNQVESDMTRNLLQSTITDFYVEVTISVRKDS